MYFISLRERQTEIETKKDLESTQVFQGNTHTFIYTEKTLYTNIVIIAFVTIAKHQNQPNIGQCHLKVK